MAPPRDVPCVPGFRLPSRSHDSVELQRDEEVTSWLNRVVMTLDARLHRVERRVARLSKVHVGAALLQTVAWVVMVLYSLAQGKPVPPPPGIPAAQMAQAQETP